MSFFKNFFGLPDIYECSSEEELDRVTNEAEERTDIAKKTNLALREKSKTLNANKKIAIANFAFWRKFANAKTEIAKNLSETSKELGQLAPKYANALMSTQKNEKRAEDKVSELAAKYGQTARGGNQSSNQNTFKGLPGSW